jgi:hypothetical protein
MEDLHRWFKEVIHSVSEGMWAHIEENGFLDQCLGVSMEWRTLIYRVVVVGAMMIVRLPLGTGGLLASGVPPVDRAPGGGDIWGHQECHVLYFYRIAIPFCTGQLIPILYRVGGTHFVSIGVRGVIGLQLMYLVYCKHSCHY